MKIDKRRPITFDVNGIKNNSKYFNMMDWKGIIENHNIYTIDQNSFEDCKNIYVDDDERLVSRDPLIENILSEEILPSGYNLIDIVNVGEDKIYVSQDVETNEYRIIIINNITYTDNENIITDITNYNICTIEHYAICFNNSDEGAKVYDPLNKTEGWQPLSNFIEVPVIKRVVGSVVTDLSSNRNYLDRNHYKEEYLWTDSLQTELPSGTSSVKVTSEGGTNLELTLTDSNILPEYRVYRKLNIKGPISNQGGINAGKISKKNNIITIAFRDYVQVSYTNGETFEKVYYPTDDIIWDWGDSRRGYIATLSDDGKNFFYVGHSAVYMYELSTKEWSSILLDGTLPIKTTSDPTDPWVSLENYHFLNSENFAFMFYKPLEGLVLIFGKGPSLQLFKETNTPYNQNRVTSGRLGVYTRLGISNSSYQYYDIGNRYKLKITYNSKYNVAVLCCILGIASNKFDIVTLIANRNINFSRVSDTNLLIKGLAINKIDVNIETIAGDTIDPYYSARVYCTGIYESTDSSYYIEEEPWIRLVVAMGLSSTTPDTTRTEYHLENINYHQLRNKIGHSTLLYTSNFNEMSTLVINDNSNYNGNLKWNDAYGLLSNPIELGGCVSTEYYDNNPLLDVKICDDTVILTREMYDQDLDNYYSEIYVNDLASGDLATFTFEYGESEPFVEVPDISYSDTELYLAFDKTLRITNNRRDEDDLYFNLPSVNDQSFIDKITALKNISTTEVAVFFEDNIYICSKVYDETLSRFRYDYYRTKLSTGVRLGDNVINTLEGSFTVFPTRRGLAALNYQAFMATTDQVITYVSDNISNYWTAFYDNSQRTNRPIHIMQWRTRLIITNGSYEMILFDLEKASWWRWEVPVSIRKCLTDQITLGLISNKLYEFKANDLYYDLPNTPNEQMIEWNMISQQLHMNAPDNYKNLRQLVFQLYDNNSNIENIYTILATIKLYRKRAEVRLPETIKFKIDELRTFVKRFNYWKVNEIQWALSSDAETHTPIKLQLNGISVKYEIGEEVR